MKRLPEYMIGGPLHGRKRDEFPNPHWYGGYEARVGMTEIQCEDSSHKPHHIPEGESIPECCPGRNSSIWGRSAREYTDRWVYVRQTFYIGGRGIHFWTDISRNARQVIASMLADVLLAPHETDEPERCICTDSIRSGGRCPSESDYEYDMCPRRTQSPEEIIRRAREIRQEEAQRAEPDNAGDGDRWEDSRDTMNGETDQSTEREPT